MLPYYEVTYYKVTYYKVTYYEMTETMINTRAIINKNYISYYGTFMESDSPSAYSATLI